MNRITVILFFAILLIFMTGYGLGVIEGRHDLMRRLFGVNRF